MLQVFLFCISIYSSFIFATSPNKVIYGEDNRFDYYEIQDPQLLELAKSTAALVEVQYLHPQSDGGFQIVAPTLVEGAICSYEKFSSQASAAMCSGFLVGPKLLLTAGHCLEHNGSCTKNAKWVFDLHVKEGQKNSAINISANDVFSCKRVIEASSNNKKDYALIELDREVDRPALKLNTKVRIQKGMGVFMIGHPLGIPTKFTLDAIVRDPGHGSFFKTNLDAFGGNSGSAVFNAETGLVEGILVAGEIDFDTDTQNDCHFSHRCPEDGCEGESVQKVSSIKYFRN